MNLKPYPKYKDSGVEWLGEVPEGWEVRRLKRIARLEYGSSLSEEAREEGSIPVYGSNGIVGEHSKSITDKPVIIIGRKGSYGKVSYSDVPCFPIDTTYYIDSSLTKENIRWFYYLLGSMALDEITFDTGVPGLSREFAYAKIVPVPSRNEQTTIANFLDHQTNRIDDLIKKNEKLIELLKEKRQAIISHAVTKGIPPHPPLEKGGWGDLKMRDSGIKWLGEIPEGWETFPIKQIIRNKVIKGIGKNLPLLSLEHIVSGEGRLVDEYIPEIVSADEHATFEIGNVLFGKLRPYLKKYYRVNFNGCCPTELMVFSPNNILLEKDYLFYLIQSNYFVSLADATSYGVKMPRTSWEAISSHYIPIPKISEQHRVVEFLDDISEKIDKTIQKIQSQIAILKEYHQTLISNVVTGKVRVN